MGRHHELKDPFLARGGEGFHVTVERGLEGLEVLPLGMIRRHRLDPIDGEQELEVERLLGPQRSVVVEDGDALGLGHEVGACRVGHPVHEVEDRVPGSPSFQDGNGSGATASGLVDQGSGARRQQHQARHGDDRECSSHLDHLFSFRSGNTPAACGRWRPARRKRRGRLTGKTSAY
jgi:hypothetical protein